MENWLRRVLLGEALDSIIKARLIEIYQTPNAYLRPSFNTFFHLICSSSKLQSLIKPCTSEFLKLFPMSDVLAYRSFYIYLTRLLRKSHTGYFNRFNFIKDFDLYLSMNSCISISRMKWPITTILQISNVISVNSNYEMA